MEILISAWLKSYHSKSTDKQTWYFFKEVQKKKFLSFLHSIYDPCWMDSSLVTQLIFVDDYYFPCRPAAKHCAICMFCLELPEDHLVTGIKPSGLLKVFVQQRVSDRGNLSAVLHGNCGFVKKGVS